jgi:uncharacterized protein
MDQQPVKGRQSKAKCGPIGALKRLPPPFAPGLTLPRHSTRKSNSLSSIIWSAFMKKCYSTSPTKILGLALIGMVINVLSGCGSIGMTAHERLMNAAKAGKAVDVERALAQGVNVNERDDAGVPPLLNAAESGNTDVVKILLDRGADVNARVIGPKREVYTTTGFQTVRNGQPGAAVVTTGRRIEYAANEDQTALIMASSRGHVAVVKMLLDRGADVNAQIGNGHWKGRTALSSAVGVIPRKETTANYLEIAGILIDKGADVNAREADDIRSDRWEEGVFNTVLMRACSNNAMNMDVVKLLVSRGADVNVVDKNGRSAFGECWSTEAREYLLAHGADIKKCGGDAIIRAAGSGKNSVVIFLLDRGADINSRNFFFEDTVLMKACEPFLKDQIDIDLLKVLLARGADVNAKNRYGETALKLLERSRMKNRDEVVALLKAAGAK